MDFLGVARSLPKSMIEEFERAIESGYWKNGMRMTSQQMDICREVLEIKRTEMLSANSVGDCFSKPEHKKGDRQLTDTLHRKQRFCRSAQSEYLH